MSNPKVANKRKRSKEEQRFWRDLQRLWFHLLGTSAPWRIEAEVKVFLTKHDVCAERAPDDPSFPQYVVCGLLRERLNSVARKKTAA